MNAFDPEILTRYALGELDETTTAEVERHLKENPEARHFVEETRKLGDSLTSAYRSEAAIESPDDDQAAVGRYRIHQKRTVQIGVPIGLLLAAACIVLFFVPELLVRGPQAAKSDNETTLTIDLPPPPPTKEATNALQKTVKPVPSSQLPHSAVALNPFVIVAPAAKTPATQTIAGSRLPSPANFGAANPARILTAMESFGQSVTPQFNTETYDSLPADTFQSTLVHPLSTFSIDVDTAAYANVRRFLNSGHRPPPGAVRIEEMINAFDYNYPAPKDGKPFAADLEVATAPWAPSHQLVRIGIKGREVPAAKRPPSNLVFLIDVSGSMDEPNKLPLVVQSLKLLTRQLRSQDHVAIVVYAGSSGLVLPSTSGSEKSTILSALERLRAGGSTNGASGINLAYKVAAEHFLKEGVNRVILATDGDFNVGVTSQDKLTRLIKTKAKSGIFLTVLGFGMGNYKDSTLEKLADQGNGNYGYIDTFQEAKRLFVQRLAGTLVTIAKDVKIQVEFNPAEVKSYRLIGYEDRRLKKEDFNDDTKNAGDIGAGHTVTALYEIVPGRAETNDEQPIVDPLKYQSAPTIKSESANDRELLTVKIRYKQPDGDRSKLLTFPLKDSEEQFASASPDFQFATAVAGFGMLLRKTPDEGSLDFDHVKAWAHGALGDDPHGDRAEFVRLVETAAALDNNS